MTYTREFFRLSPNQLDSLRTGLAAFAGQFPHAAILDSCGLENSIFPTGNESFSLIAGFAEKQIFPHDNFAGKLPGTASDYWHFGHLAYELKDKIEPGLTSSHPAVTGFGETIFFMAELVFLLRKDELEVLTCNAESPARLLEKVMSAAVISPEMSLTASHFFNENIYLEKCKRILHHLHRGDIYELNYCIPFYAEVNNFLPATCWLKLNMQSPAPFSALYRQQNSWLISASPERFLKRSGNRIYSQPIKGTSSRNEDPLTDEKNKSELINSEKERAENIMITDLVRNDLSRIAKRGSVRVDELCGLYSFRHVHQMITTVSAELKNDTGMQEIISALFPMGSMTGAPKYRAMQIIDECEDFRREIFSGSVGYIAPGGNFDFNVVIRSIIYNAATGKIIIPAGSAVTAKSDPLKELEECRLKAAALIALLQNPVNA